MDKEKFMTALRARILELESSKNEVCNSEYIEIEAKKEELLQILEDVIFGHFDIKIWQ